MGVNCKHTVIELALAEKLFDAFQKSINAHEHTLKHHGRYCSVFENLEARQQTAWIATARSLLTPVGGEPC